MAGDPVADQSGFLCMYMSTHPDTLVSYVRYWGKVTAQVSIAKMIRIDTKVRASCMCVTARSLGSWQS